MPRIPLDDPIFAPDPPLAPGNRSPLDVMVETAANEEQNILGAMYNNSVQEVASPHQKVSVTGPVNPALFKPDLSFQWAWDQAKDLGIAPPASSNPRDLQEFLTRASKQRENSGSWWKYNQKRFRDWDI